MSIREATHADSWYTGNAQRLAGELAGFLAAVAPSAEFAPPIAGCKAIVAPHAGYSYSGPAAAWAYRSIDTTGIKRVFILGPSHHVYLDGCALSKCSEYATPIGNLPLDRETIEELKATGEFSEMSIGVDEEEHSIEMHLPYVRKVFEGKDIAIVPVLVGAIGQEQEAHFGRLLAPHLARADTLCVVSSDFCHWGTRFSYTFYYPKPPPSATPAVRLARGGPRPDAAFPIHASIAALDREALDILTLPPRAAAAAHAAFAAYLARTGNTICGRHPLGVLLGALGALEGGGRAARVRWVRYEQSSACEGVQDSSVSYASAYVVF